MILGLVPGKKKKPRQFCGGNNRSCEQELPDIRVAPVLWGVNSRNTPLQYYAQGSGANLKTISLTWHHHTHPWHGVSGLTFAMCDFLIWLSTVFCESAIRLRHLSSQSSDGTTFLTHAFAIWFFWSGVTRKFEKQLFTELKQRLGVVVNTFNPSSWEGEAGALLWVWDQTGSHRQTLSQKQKQIKIDTRGWEMAQLEKCLLCLF